MKRLVVLCDGTWNSADARNKTNVVKLRNAVRIGTVQPDLRQLVYYQQGVGAEGGLLSLNHWLGGLAGHGLWTNVQLAYKHIVDYYTLGDEIWLFGFSRGAYTARSVAGMLRKCGVLRKDQVDRIEEAYEFYRNSEVKPDDGDAITFRNDHAIPDPAKPADDPNRCVPPIKFVGVWDTVGALGVPLRKFDHKHEFHDVALSRIVETAYHAIAIDERRSQFRPALWEQHPQAIGQTMEQRWFAGVHGNIGGGGGTSRQSDRVLLWMIQKAQASGLVFDATVISQYENLLDGSIGDSLVNRIWRAIFKHIRPIGKGVPDKLRQYAGPPAERSHEHLDAAVLTRNAADGYMPSNLATYFGEDAQRRIALDAESTAVWP